jgi:hypothetical protein
MGGEAGTLGGGGTKKVELAQDVMSVVLGGTGGAGRLSSGTGIVQGRGGSMGGDGWELIGLRGTGTGVARRLTIRALGVCRRTGSSKGDEGSGSAREGCSGIGTII